MIKIEKDGKLYAISVSFNFIHNEEGTQWLGDPNEPLQASRMQYNSGKIFKKHIHLLRPRQHDYTQEAFAVMKGCVWAEICDEDGKLISSAFMRSGDFLIIYRGSHRFKVMQDDTVFFEIKNSGPFTSAEEDKVFLEQ